MKRRFVLVLAMVCLPAVASAATRVSSDSNCPSSDAISVRLLGLLAAGGPENASARVHNEGQSLRIEVSAPGEYNQQRTVATTGDCDDRVEISALVIASWLDAMPVGTIAAPGIPPRERRPMSGARGGADPSDDPDWEPTRTSRRTLVGAGLFGLADSQGESGGLALSVGMPALIEDLGLLLEASLGLPRELSVGAGRARYWRPTFALQGSAGLSGKHWGLRLLVGPALGVLKISGSGYDKNLNEATVTWGVDVGLAVTRSVGKHEGWISLGAMAWPQGRRIRSKPDSSTSEVALPDWEARLAAGFSWGIGR